MTGSVSWDLVPQTHRNFQEWQVHLHSLRHRHLPADIQTQPQKRGVWGGHREAPYGWTGSYEEPGKVLVKSSSLSLALLGPSLAHTAGHESIRTGCLFISGLWWAPPWCSPFCTCKLQRNKTNSKVWPAGIQTRPWWANTWNATISS